MVGLTEGMEARRWLESMSIMGLSPAHMMSCMTGTSVEVEAYAIAGVPNDAYANTHPGASGVTFL